MATGESSSTAPAEVLGETITSAPEEVAGALAATGSNPFGLSVVALALLGAGFGVLALRRRRLSAAPR
jgi:LPXTG-motif cell wall-anchored protein